jgi:ribonuclease HII
MMRALERAIASGLRRLEVPHKEVRVMLDGTLHAPAHYAQETIVRGDDLIPIISLASIIAKVRRDRLMRRLAHEYPHYGFEQHKGYGTQAHYNAIEQFGLCEIHRRSYCQRVDQSTQSTV